MIVTYKSDRCVMIKVIESQEELRQHGWMGDEKEIRVFYPSGKPDANNREIRVFKANGESYVLKDASNDEMVNMKIRIILNVIKNA